jgi:putative ABC transport system permease protein
MLTVALKGLFAHKLRLAMTALSIAIGVAFVAGTLILTDTLDASLGRAAADRYASVGVVVRSQNAFADGESVQDARQPVPESLLAAVKAVSGVADAEGRSAASP